MPGSASWAQRKARAMYGSAFTFPGRFRVVVPRIGFRQLSGVFKGLIDHVPGEDLADDMLHHPRDVVVKKTLITVRV